MLTRFRGYLMLMERKGVHDAKESTAVSGGISPTDDRAGASVEDTRAAFA